MAKFYPKLESLLDVNSLPSSLSFLSTIGSNLLNHVYFRSFQHVVNPESGSVSYSLTLVLFKRLGVTFPGAEIEFVLNPDYEPELGATEIPVSLNLQHEGRLLLPSFSWTHFSGEGPEWFFLASKASGITPGSLIMAVCSNVLNEEDDPLESLAMAINASGHLSNPIPLPLDSDPEVVISDLISHIGANATLSLIEILYDLYVDDPDPTELSNKLTTLLGLQDESVIDWLKRLFIPRINAGATLSAGVLFPRQVLIPVDNNGEVVPGDERFQIVLDAGSFYLDSYTGRLGFEKALTFSSEPYPQTQIGKTGIYVGFSGGKLDLSTNTSIPEADAAGYPSDFVGVYIQLANVSLPAFWQTEGTANAEIKGRDLIIGTGGFSGNIGLEESGGNSLLHTSVGGFNITLDAFDITFRQNDIISSNIHGTLTIPGFKDAEGSDALIEITASIDKGGNFTLTASEEQGVDLHLLGILTYRAKSVSIGKQGNDWFLSTSGSLKFNFDSSSPFANFCPQSIDIKKLTIWSDGRFEIEGGKLTLPESVTLNVGPAKINVTAIHLGAHEQVHNGIMRKYKYFGFDGGLSIDPVGIDAHGDGIKIYFTVDNDPPTKPLHVFMRIEAINIDLIIPGDAKPQDATLLLQGYLSLKGPSAAQPNAGEEYTGGVSFSLPKAGITGSAQMRMQPKVPAFIVDAALELPKPIPLASTGLGIYGFRGLFGQRYVASREAEALIGVIGPDAKWWEYYKAKVPQTYREGVQIAKFKQQPGFSVGAGVSVATAPDGGRTFSSKLFFLLSIKEVLLLQGQAAILSKRIGLDTTTDPPFFAMIAISSSSIEIGLGVIIGLPKEWNNKLVNIEGLVELGFFWRDARAWYLHIGTQERPLQASLLDILRGYAFVMISNAGFRFGAGVHFYKRGQAGPAYYEVEAYIDLLVFINSKHFQAGGHLRLGGSVEVGIWKVKIGVSIAVTLAGEAPKPFLMTGEIEVCVKIIKKFCFRLNFTYEKDTEINLTELQIIEEQTLAALPPAKGVNIATKEPYIIAHATGQTIPAPTSSSWSKPLSQVTVPMDTYIDMELLKPVLPDTSSTSVNAIGGHMQASTDHINLMAPQHAYSVQVKHEYKITNIHIKYHNGTSWQDYDPYLAAIQLADLPLVNTSDLQNKKKGFWQLQEPGKHNKLRLLAQTPLSYLDEGNPAITILEQLGIASVDLLCEDEMLTETCIDWVDVPVGTTYKASSMFGLGAVLFRITGYDGKVDSMSNPFQISPSLVTVGKSKVEIFLPEPTAEITLRLSTNFESVTVVLYRREYEDSPPFTGVNGLPNMTYEEVHSQVADAG